MDTILLYVIAGAGLLASLLKDRGKTVKALNKAWKAFEGILPQLLVVLILVAVTLAVLDTATIARYLGGGSGPLGVIIAAPGRRDHADTGLCRLPRGGCSLERRRRRDADRRLRIQPHDGRRRHPPHGDEILRQAAALLRNGFAFIFSFVAAIFVGWVVGL